MLSCDVASCWCWGSSDSRGRGRLTGSKELEPFVHFCRFVDFCSTLAQGLEFDDVFIHNFFRDSKVPLEYYSPR